MPGNKLSFHFQAGFKLITTIRLKVTHAVKKINDQIPCVSFDCLHSSFSHRQQAGTSLKAVVYFATNWYFRIFPNFM